MLSNIWVEADICIGVPHRSKPTATMWFLRGDMGTFESLQLNPKFLKIRNNELHLRVNLEVHKRISAPVRDTQSLSGMKHGRNKSTRRSISPWSPSMSFRTPSTTSRIRHLTPIDLDVDDQLPAYPTTSSSASGSRYDPVELDDDDDDSNITLLRPNKLLKGRKLDPVDLELQSLIQAEDGFDVFTMTTKYTNYMLSSGRLVPRYQIIRALGYEASWARQALDGAKLINVYGPAGSHPAPEVIAKLEAKEPSGAGPLLDYLPTPMPTPSTKMLSHGGRGMYGSAGVLIAFVSRPSHASVEYATGKHVGQSGDYWVQPSDVFIDIYEVPTQAPKDRELSPWKRENWARYEEEKECSVLLVGLFVLLQLLVATNYMHHKDHGRPILQLLWRMDGVEEENNENKQEEGV
ncbi:hypothetical protein ONZ45_g10580 [Pleurotus djamor]|nr:hypothetical protein ONZ45_g10580 [Pleurotus djamor]